MHEAFSLLICKKKGHTYANRIRLISKEPNPQRNWTMRIKQCTQIFLLEICYAQASTTWGNLYGTIMPRWHCVSWRSRVTCKTFVYFQTYILDISDRLKQRVKTRLTPTYILLANWVNVKNGVHQVDQFHFFVVKFQISMCKLFK